MVETDGTSEKLRVFFKRYMELYPAKARVNRYKDATLFRYKIESDPKTRENIRVLLTSAKLSLQAIEKGDIDHFAQEFERVIRDSVNLPVQLPDVEKVQSQVAKNMGHDGGIKSKRPREDFWILLELIVKTIGSNDQKDVRAWWCQWTDEDAPLDADDHVALDFRTWAENGVYHFESDGQKTPKTARDIQKILSEIRKA
jgi:hypothetical protein